MHQIKYPAVIVAAVAAFVFQHGVVHRFRQAASGAEFCGGGRHEEAAASKNDRRNRPKRRSCLRPGVFSQPSWYHRLASRDPVRCFDVDWLSCITFVWVCDVGECAVEARMHSCRRLVRQNTADGCYPQPVAIENWGSPTRGLIWRCNERLPLYDPHFR